LNLRDLKNQALSHLLLLILILHKILRPINLLK